MVLSNTSCGLTPIDDDCDLTSTPPPCTGPTSYMECLPRDDGTRGRHDYTCPAGRHCTATSSSTTPCDGDPIGSSCQSDATCADNLRCVDGVCSGPTENDVNRCKTAQEVLVSDDGTETSLTLQFDPPTNVAALIARPACSAAFQRDAFLRLRVAPSSMRRFAFAFGDDRQKSIALTRVNCADLYRRTNDLCGVTAGAVEASVGTAEIDVLVAVMAGGVESPLATTLKADF